MKILKTPWKNDLMNLVSKSKESIKITSPFVKENVCNELLFNKKKNTEIELITSFKLKNVFNGSIDLKGIENIINHNGKVKTYQKLHSKIYLFDDKKVIITSGNLTNGGLVNNYEYGIYTEDQEIVSKVVNDFYLISTNENTGNIELSNIKLARKILAKIPASTTISLNQRDLDNADFINDVIDIPDQIITKSLKGWQLEIYKCAQSIQSQEFSLKEINKFEPYLKSVFPANKHITDKIRQQLQYLRNLGLIEFLGNGKYRKLWK